MPARVAGIQFFFAEQHVFAERHVFPEQKDVVDGRDKPGHDAIITVLFLMTYS
jgi:hypothetical protein